MHRGCGASPTRRSAPSPCTSLRAIRLFNPDAMANFARRLHAAARPVAAGAPRRPRQSAAAFPEKSPPRSSRSCAASGTISAASAPSSRISTGCGTTTASTAAAASSPRTRASRSSMRLRDDGKPALIFAAHLANWELRGGRRAQLRPRHRGAVSAGPTSRAISDAIIEMRAGCMGTLVPTGLQAPVRLAEALQRGSHVAHAGRSIRRAGRAGDLLRPPDPRQRADRAARPQHRMPDPRHPRGALSAATASS